MGQNETVLQDSILQGHTDAEKGAYLAAIASLATADRQATPQEVEYITHLSNAANLPDAQKQIVLNAAKETSGDELKKSLDVLKNSELKYSLVTDLIAFAKSDNNYSEEESQYIQKVAQYLGVDQKQVAVLNHVAENAKPADPSQQGSSEPGFLSSIKEKLQSLGISSSTLTKGLIAIGGTAIFSKMFANRSGGGGTFGGIGNVLAGAGVAGGLTSLIGMLSGGGKGMGGAGSLLDRVLGKTTTA